MFQYPYLASTAPGAKPTESTPTSLHRNHKIASQNCFGRALAALECRTGFFGARDVPARSGRECKPARGSFPWRSNRHRAATEGPVALRPNCPPKEFCPAPGRFLIVGPIKTQSALSGGNLTRACCPRPFLLVNFVDLLCRPFVLADNLRRSSCRVRRQSLHPPAAFPSQYRV